MFAERAEGECSKRTRNINRSLIILINSKLFFCYTCSERQKDTDTIKKQSNLNESKVIHRAQFKRNFIEGIEQNYN